LRIKAVLGVVVGVSAIVGMASPVFAQGSAGDVSVGYSILHDSDIEETFPMGWLVAGGINLGSNVALVGEAGGNYKTVSVLGTDVDLRVHSFLGGVRVQGRQPKAMPFGQFLVGVAHGAYNVLGEGDSSNGFAMQPGGGVDIALSSSVGTRIQADYRIIRSDGDTSNEFRVGFGLVFGFRK
jgi:opacity protein-like surface antigen